MGFMKPVRQEDSMGCAVACVAFVLEITYEEAIKLFEDGPTRVKSKADFYCPEIVRILNSNGLNYRWKKLKGVAHIEAYSHLSIVFVKRSAGYPYGHFLARYKKKWMDPWINIPDKNMRAGFRKYLPGNPTYVVYRKI